MQYFELTFLILFLPLVMLIYQLVGKKKRPFILLIASYIFIYTLSGKLLVYLLLATLCIHHFGIWLDANKKEEKEQTKDLDKEEKKQIKLKYLKQRKGILFLGILILMIMITLTKYMAFIGVNINHFLALFKINLNFKLSNLVAPIGISFYTFSAISYLVDVYRGKIKADNNLFKLALFLAFFPQIMEGPISRYEDTAENLYEGKKITYHNMCFGIQRICYGLLKKLVIADRLNTPVKLIFNGYDKYGGLILLLGAILYTIQLYMDFSGIIDIVIGTGEIFGIKLPENFRQPFFSKNISEFWSRWHITLGTWFKDYIFYPISLSKMSRKITNYLRKKIGNHFGPLVAGTIALGTVWLCNGLWHGAAYHYVFFGFYHFVLILMANIFNPAINKFYEICHINPEQFFIKAIRIIKTIIFVIFGELFFRAQSLKIGLVMFKKIFTEFNISSLNWETLNALKLFNYELIIIGITLLIVFVISIIKEKGINIREKIAKKPIYIRWMIYYALILYVIIFGAYGGLYIPIDPMYADF